MTQANVDEMLRNYKRNMARCAHLELRMEEYEKLAEEERGKAMAGDALRGQSLTGMPKAGGVRSPVEELVEKYMDGYVPPLEKSIRLDIGAMAREYEKAKRATRYVEGWLGCLPKREKTVIEKQMIEGLLWSEVEKAAEAELGIAFSQAGLKKMRKRGLSAIYEVAGAEKSA